MPEKRESNQLRLSRQKGWPGFVHGYNKFVAAAEKVWDKIDWGENGNKSGAKSVEKKDDGATTVYKY